MFAVVYNRSKYFKSCHVAWFQDPAQSPSLLVEGVLHIFVGYEDIF